MMVSKSCSQRASNVIPSLLAQYASALLPSTPTIDLSTAENHFMQTRLQEHGRRYPNLMMDALLSYSPGIGGPSVARQAFASLFNAYFQPITKISESHIVLAAGGSYALEALVEQICDPGDAILVMAPYWAGFDISLGIKVPVQLIPVHVPLEKCFDVESVDYYEEAIRAAGPRVKAVLVCNPQNPLGRYYPSKTLKALLRFCEEWDLHYISDEVYALSRHARNDEVVKDDVFHSILSFADVNAKKIHVVYSLSKDFGCSGVRLGCLVTLQNEAVRLSAALSCHQQVSNIATHYAINYVLVPENMRAIELENAAEIRAAYFVLTSTLLEHQIHFYEAHAGIFVFAQLCPNASQESERQFGIALKNQGLVLASGTSYHFSEPGWFRICYAVSHEILQEGLDRLLLCIQESRLSPVPM